MFTLIKPDTKFDFMGKHRLFFTISAVAIVLSLASLAFRGLNKGIDFVGGTKIIVSFKKPIDRDQLRKLMTLMVEREAHFGMCRSFRGTDTLAELRWRTLPHDRT